MLLAVAILVLTAAIGVVGSRVLTSARWPLRAPRIGIWAWVALSLNIVLGTVVALSVAAGSGSLHRNLVDLWVACTAPVPPTHLTPVNALSTGVGVLAGLALLVRLSWAAVAVLTSTRRERRHTTEMTDMLGQTTVVAGATVLEHEVAFAFCVPGRDRRIVMTSTAVARLTPPQLNAVLAHERAHLSGRHHLPLVVLQVLRTALPFMKLFDQATSQAAMLVEVAADDVARRKVGAGALGGALAALTDHCLPVSGVALAATSVAVETRLRRLNVPTRPLRVDGSIAACAATAFAMALPLVAVVGPVWKLLYEVVCLLD